MPREAGSDYYLVALMYPRDSRLRSEDGSRRSSAARFALLALPAAVAGAPAFVVVSVVAPAAYSPGDFAPHSFAVLVRTTAQPAPHSFLAVSTIPRIGVFVSFPVTTADSDSCRSFRPPAPAAASRSTAQNLKSHHNFPAPTYSG